MQLISVATALIAVIGLSSPALSQEEVPLEDVIQLRQALMKGNQEAATIAVKMIRGTNPYDADLAVAAMTSIANTNGVFPALFPEGTETGANTKATAAVWETPDDLAAISAKMVEDATAAAAAAAEGKDAFQAAFGAVGANCQACHEKYRMN
jgi:cytochrome c556